MHGNLRFPPVPPEELAGLLALASRSENELAELEAALSRTRPVINRQSFISTVPKVPGLDREVQNQMVGALLFLHSFLVADGLAGTDLVGALGASLLARRVTEESVTRLAEILPRFLTLGSLHLRAKAVDLKTDHQHPLQMARVITDARPVFGGTPQEISGIVVFHTLKLRYFSNDSVEESYLTLDDGDVARLIGALERSQIKGKTLREMIQRQCDVGDFEITPSDKEE